MKKILSLMLTLCMLFALVGSVNLAKAEEPVKLKLVTVGSGMPTNYAAWQTKINEYLAEKIGVNVDVEVIGWGDWDKRRSIIINTNEPYDIVFGNSGVYNTDVELGAYLDITELVPKAAPELYAYIPESYWDACRVNGKIYAVPTYKDSSQTNYLIWDKDLLDKLGLDASGVSTLQEATPLLEKMHEELKAPAFPIAKGGYAQVLSMYDQMSSGFAAIGVRFDDAQGKVVKVMEQADVMENLNTFHSWYKAGIVNADAATLPEENKYKPCGIAQGWSGAAKTVWGPNMGVNAVAYKWLDTIVSNETVRGSLNSISIDCQNPEKALEFLQLLNSDSYVRDSFYYGLEGDNWQYTEDKKVHKNNSEWTMAGYTQATFFNVTPTDDVEFNQWDEVKALNESAKPSVLLGFTFDTKPVQDQIANCTEIFNRHRAEILTGTGEPAEAVKAMYDEMEVAGINDIIAEAQKQVDEFLKK